eukprot:gene83-12907_t
MKVVVFAAIDLVLNVKDEETKELRDQAAADNALAQQLQAEQQERHGGGGMIKRARIAELHMRGLQEQKRPSVVAVARSAWLSFRRKDSRECEEKRSARAELQEQGSIEVQRALAAKDAALAMRLHAEEELLATKKDEERNLATDNLMQWCVLGAGPVAVSASNINNTYPSLYLKRPYHPSPQYTPAPHATPEAAAATTTTTTTPHGTPAQSAEEHRIARLESIFDSTTVPRQLLVDVLRTVGWDFRLARRALREAGISEVPLEQRVMPVRENAPPPLPSSLLHSHSTPPNFPSHSVAYTSGASSSRQLGASGASSSRQPGADPMDVDERPLSNNRTDYLQRVYDRHRRTARDLTKEREELLTLSRSEYDAGNDAAARMNSDEAKALKEKIREEHALASQNIMYSDQAKALKDKIREEHALASQNIYNATNEHVENKWSVDLHGQHVQEALKQITTLCDMFKTMPSKKLIRVVTGRGAHSKGDPKLLLAVRDWLREQGYQFTEGVGFFDVVIPAPPPRGA